MSWHTSWLLDLLATLGKAMRWLPRCINLEVSCLTFKSIPNKLESDLARCKHTHGRLTKAPFSGQLELMSQLRYVVNALFPVVRHRSVSESSTTRHSRPPNHRTRLRRIRIGIYPDVLFKPYQQLRSCGRLLFCQPQLCPRSFWLSLFA
jgi:hypothetical protein